MKPIVLVALFVACAQSHSWLGCADYSSQADMTWNYQHCRAYARNAYKSCVSATSNALAGGFGQECSLDYSGSDIAGSQQIPRPATISSAYTATYPMATYQKGQFVCLAWPAKNHAAATCTNQYIPDGGIFLGYSGVNPTADPAQSVFDANRITPFGNGVHVDSTIDFHGFQNCSLFCEDTGNAFCSGCFTVPTSLSTGMYTFQWSWTFNTGQTYKTLFDVNVVAAGASGNPPAGEGYPSSSGGSPPPPPSPSTPPPSNPTTPPPSNPTPPPSNPTTPPPTTPPGPCSVGGKDCPCTTGGSCDAGLTCNAGVCRSVSPAATLFNAAAVAGITLIGLAL